MKKLVKESSFVTGAGFSYAGGVGGSSNSLANSMYTYDIKALNHSLESKPTADSHTEEIHIGLTISGKTFRDPKTIYTGKLIDIIRKNDDIKYYVILDEKNKTKIKLNPTTVIIVKNDDIPKTMDDIWDYSLNSRGNYYTTRKNESKIVAESLEELNEEQLGFIQQNVKIYLNPENLENINPWSRAISDEEGNLYIVSTATVIHNKIIEYLHNKGILPLNAKWIDSKGCYENLIAWQRENYTNNFYLSESYSKEILRNTRIWEELNDLKELLEIENTQYNFYLSKIEDPEY